MEHTKHIIRAVLILVVAAVVFVFARHFLYPASFGEHGQFRFDSVAEHASPAPRHGFPGACLDCHDEQGAALSEGKHGSVDCEVCHATLSSHVKEDKRVAAMRVNGSVEMCGWCHERLAARPVNHPQVVIDEHVKEKGEVMREKVCLECHDAHNPSE